MTTCKIIRTSPTKAIRNAAIFVTISFYSLFAIGAPVMVDNGQLAIEEARVLISLSGPNNGTLLASCPDCPPVRLVFDNSSEAFLNQEKVSLERASEISGGTKSVIYQPQTNTVVKFNIRTN